MAQAIVRSRQYAAAEAVTALGAKWPDRGSTGSLEGNLSPHPWALLSGGRPRGQLALYKVAPRRDSGKLLPILDCSSWEDSPEQSTTLTPLAAATRSCRCRVCAAPLLLSERRALGERLQACSGFSSRATHSVTGPSPMRKLSAGANRRTCQSLLSKASESDAYHSSSRD